MGWQGAGILPSSVWDGKLSMWQERVGGGAIVQFYQNGIEGGLGARNKGSEDVGCPGEGLRLRMEVCRVLQSPVSVPVSDQLLNGKILGNLSTLNNANGKERSVVTQALCWALYHMCRSYGVSQPWSKR